MKVSSFPTQTYLGINKNKIDAEFLRNKLKYKSLKAQRSFAKKYPKATKVLKEKGFELGKLREHSGKLITAGALTGSLILSRPEGLSTIPANTMLPKEGTLAQGTATSAQEVVVESLSKSLPQRARPLSRQEEKSLEQLFESTIGVKARATLEGEHLNTTYGYIGAEQHLRRYPGDTMATHPKVPEDDEGMAPGLGAWGYFAPSKAALTPQLVETEKWYAVVQTLYLPDWAKRQPYLRDWYKYRKVLIVNTKNGNAVVASIADSGPAAWTGKHFGGSPEVMNYLGGPRYKKGPVILFFVDDPGNRVPLGPVEYNKMTLPNVALHRI